MVCIQLAKKTLIWGLIASLGAELTACGTILYPERKGAKSGQIDPAVALLDGVGLLVFFIPGVIAFAVDFNNGTIYLPHGRHSSLTPAELDAIKTKGQIDSEMFNKIMSKKLSATVDLKQSGTQVEKAPTTEAMIARVETSQLILASLK